MNKIRDKFEKIFVGLFFFAITYFLMGQFGVDYAKSTINFYKGRNQYIVKIIKLDSTSYGYSEGSTSTNPYIHCKINGKIYTLESFNNSENQNIADIIEIQNKPVIKKVWYHKEGNGSVVYSTLFGKIFPWKRFAIRNIIIIIILLIIPLILAVYILKNTIKLIILIYKKEYYNVEVTD